MKKHNYIKKYNEIIKENVCKFSSKYKKYDNKKIKKNNIEESLDIDNYDLTDILVEFYYNNVMDIDDYDVNINKSSLSDICDITKLSVEEITPIILDCMKSMKYAEMRFMDSENDDELDEEIIDIASNYANKIIDETSIKESVIIKGDVYSVYANIDIPQSFINSYVKKVKDEKGQNIRQIFGDMQLAEELTKYILTTNLDIDKIPSNALLSDGEDDDTTTDVQGQAQPQATTQAQPQGQNQAQPQAQQSSQSNPDYEEPQQHTQGQAQQHTQGQSGQNKEELPK